MEKSVENPNLVYCARCRKCHTYNGDWFCGLCPSCADRTEGEWACRQCGHHGDFETMGGEGAEDPECCGSPCEHTLIDQE